MARRVRVRGSRRQVWNGSRQKNKSGLTKSDFMLNKNGKLVSKKKHAFGRRQFKNIRGWINAVSKARKALGITGFCAVKKGTPLYIKAREFYCAPEITEKRLILIGRKFHEKCFKQTQNVQIDLAWRAAQLNARPLSPPSVTKH